MERNVILEWCWRLVGFAIYLPIFAALVIAAVNISAVYRADAVLEKTEYGSTEATKREATIYIEETRFSENILPLMEVEQNETESGYLVTEEMRMVAQLVQSEAGNQDLDGKRLVADVVLNRVDDDRFPDTIEEVIFQKNPVQFGVTVDGAFEKAGGDVSEESFEAVRMEWERETRLDENVVYFNGVHENGKNPFKHGGHWFSY